MSKKKTVSQCITSDYCRGWNAAIDEMEKKKPSKELEFEVKTVGVKYSESDGLPIGLVLDNGFTFGFADKNGNPVPLNPEAIERWRDRCNGNERICSSYEGRAL